MDRKTKGIKGEALAKTHYKNRGFEILESNFRHRRAEIDFIALNEEESLLVFVEVKRRSRNDFGDPESFVSERQQDLIREAAEEYIFGINWSKTIRFDIVAISANEELDVFEDAF